MPSAEGELPCLDLCIGEGGGTNSGGFCEFGDEECILRELIFAGINFDEFREFLTISRKLVPAKIIGDCAAREIGKN